MKFEAKGLDLTLELGGQVNAEGKRETKTFKPKERITADFATKVIKEMKLYLKTQKDLPEAAQDRVFETNLKFLAWVYPDIDIPWIKANFTYIEINDIKVWAFEGLSGVKKDGEN